MEYSELYAMRIRQLCKQRGLSINKLADMSNVRQSSIDNIINGRTKNPGVVNLHKIALDFKELNEFSFEDNDSGEL